MSDKYTVHDVLNSLGPVGLARIGSVYNRWKAFNEQLEQGDKISFAAWCDSYGRLNELSEALDTERTRVTKLEEENDNLRDEIEKLKDSMQGIRQLVRQLEEHNTKFKVAPSEQEFEEFRMKMYKFNKKNAQRPDAEKLRFGQNLDIVKSLSSLNDFLNSPHAQSMGMRKDAIEYFRVFVKDGSLVTLDRSYKDGVGFGSLWIPSSKYGKPASEDWESSDKIRTDPRLEYVDPGTNELWVPTTSMKKRKLDFET